MIEVHGQYEEYLMTVRGELLEEVEGTSLYECRINLKKMQSEILLKVVPISHYGFQAVQFKYLPSYLVLQTKGSNNCMAVWDLCSDKNRGSYPINAISLGAVC